MNTVTATGVGDWADFRPTTIDASAGIRNFLQFITVPIHKVGIEVKFQKLVSQWRAATYYSSSISKKVDHPAFREIVEMGEDAKLLIISELKTKPDFLYLALHMITGEDPSPPSASGNPRAMVEAWLLWAEGTLLDTR